LERECLVGPAKKTKKFSYSYCGWGGGGSRKASNQHLNMKGRRGFDHIRSFCKTSDALKKRCNDAGPLGTIKNQATMLEALVSKGAEKERWGGTKSQVDRGNTIAKIISSRGK